MKKTMNILMILVLLLSYSGCSEKKIEEKKLKNVPSGFYRDYEQAEFSTYNSNASENGLGGSKIWVEGSYDEVLTLDTDGVQYFLVIFKTIDNHEWLIVLDANGYGPIESYEKHINNQMVILGEYDGYSGVYSMPVIYLNSLYDRKDGSITSSVAFSPQHEDSNTPQQPEETPQKDEEKEPELEPNKDKEEQTSVIRPDVKEAIDAYEAFIDEYIAFMEKYEESDSSFEMLTEYMNYTNKLLELENKMNSLDKDLNDAESLYYSDVMLRCSYKLLQAGY